MFLCVYINMSCVYVYIHVCINTFVYTYSCKYICNPGYIVNRLSVPYLMQVCVYTCMYLCMFIKVSRFIYTYMMDIYSCLSLCKYIYNPGYIVNRLLVLYLMHVYMDIYMYVFVCIY
jgi:hypothetical protein